MQVIRLRLAGAGLSIVRNDMRVGVDLIRDLINNYIEQRKIYQQVAASSLEQTTLLQNPTIDLSLIKDVVGQRQVLMDDVTAMNDEAKILKEKIKNSYALNAFTLSELQGKLGTSEFIDLKQVLDQLGDILKTISQNDLKNQALMRIAAAENAARPSTSSQQASNAYRQSMDRKNS